MEIFKQKKNYIFPILFLGLILLLAPSGAHGWWGGDYNPMNWDWGGEISGGISGITDLIKIVGNLLETVSIIIVKAVGLGMILCLLILAIIGNTLFAVTAVLLKWTMEVILFVGITPANPQTPDIITVGWELCRDLVNISFVLILVLIGLATILRIKEYEAKKALPLLIMVALLINFTPVIVGFVVDMGNIMTKFFLDKAGEPITSFAGVKNIITGLESNIGQTIGEIIDPGFNILDAIGDLANRAVYALILNIFFAFGILVYALIVLIFFYRIVMLWILTVLSPVAFFSLAAGKTKEIKWLFPGILHWDKWWEELIKWVIVGIPIGFFLWLSSSIMGADPGKIFGSTPPVSESLKASLAEIIEALLSPGLGLALLGIGITISMESMPDAAKKIMDVAKQAGQGLTNIGSNALKRTAGKGAGALAGGLGKVSSSIGKASSLIEGSKIGKMRGVGTAIKGVTRPMAWASRAVPDALVPGLLEYEAEARRTNTPKDFGGWNTTKQEQWINSNINLDSAGRVKASSAIDDLGDTSEEFRENLFKDVEEQSTNSNSQNSVKNYFKFFPEKHSSDMGRNMAAASKTTKAAKKEAMHKYNQVLTKEVRKIEKDKDLEDEILRSGATVEDIAAQKIFIQKRSDKDIAKIDNLGSIAVRLALPNRNFNTLNTLRNNYGKSDVEDTFDGTGGINQRLKSKNEVDQMGIINQIHRDNPNWLKSFFTTTAGQAWNFEGRNSVKDFVDKNFINYEPRKDSSGKQAYGLYEDFRRIVGKAKMGEKAESAFTKELSAYKNLDGVKKSLGEVHKELVKIGQNPQDPALLQQRKRLLTIAQRFNTEKATLGKIIAAMEVKHEDTLRELRENGLLRT